MLWFKLPSCGVCEIEARSRKSAVAVLQTNSRARFYLMQDPFYFILLKIAPMSIDNFKFARRSLIHLRCLN